MRQSSQPGHGAGAGFPPGQAIGIFCTSIGVLLLTGGLFAPAGVAGILLAQVVCFGSVPVVAAVMRHGAGAGAALGLRRPRARALAGAACVGASFWYINLWLTVPVAERYLGGEEEIAHLETLVTAAPAWLVLLALVAAPAVCEELLVRGVVARSLRPAIGRAGAVLASAALFALLHFSVARLLPTALFGVVLAHAALASGSILPSMLIHALNNTIALALTWERLPALAAAIETHPDRLGAGALVICLAGLALLRPISGPRTEKS